MKISFLYFGFSATFSHSYKLADINKNSRGDKVVGPGSGGPFTDTDGFLSYYEICMMISDGGVKKWDNQSNQPYVYKDDKWVGFDDIKSFKLKVK